jgi:N-acetylmuramoyl-L-alanine amidase
VAVTVPGAELILGNPISTRPIVRLKWILCHTIVGTVAGALSGRHYHIYVRGDGSFIQRQDLLLRSAASVEANPYSIAIVCEDKGPHFSPWSGSNVPPYTPQQVATLTVVMGWICRRFGLPTSAIRTTCLNDANGIGWHRLGIDGDFPNVWPYWGRRPGCLETSLSTGKPCPGNARITQIVNDIVPRLGGQPPSGEWDEMATQEEVQAAVDNVFDAQMSEIAGIGGTDRAYKAWAGYVYQGARKADVLEAKLDKIITMLEAE